MDRNTINPGLPSYGFTSFNNSASLSKSVGKEKTGTLVASRNKPNSSKIRKEVAQLIEEEFLMRTYAIVRKEDGKLGSMPAVAIACSENDPQKAKKYENCLKTLKGALLSLVNSSDEAARIVQKFLTNKQCNFFIVEPDDMSKFGLEKDTIAAAYFPQLKSILIPTSILLGEDYCLQNFQDLLLHESIHAFDDLLVLDTDPKEPKLYSKDVIKQQLKPFFSAELDKSRLMLESLRAIRTMRVTKQAKLNNPAATQEEINKAVEKSFIERPLQRVHIHDAEEMDIITKNTWCWCQTTNEYIVVPFVKFANDNLDTNKTYDSAILSLEYMAYGLNFFLSADPTIRERFQRQAPDFYNYIKTTLLPLFNR